MNTTMIDTKDVILALKQVKEEKNLSLDSIVQLMESNDPGTAVSKTTLSRVFAKGSEDQIFRYETTLKPIANVLLDIESVKSDDNIDTKAYKAILRLKKDLIEELEEKLTKVESEEKAKYHEKLDEERAKFQRSLNFLKEQIELKDKRIDQLMDSNDRLSIMNNKMLEQFLDCPLKNKDCKHES